MPGISVITTPMVKEPMIINAMSQWNAMAVLV